MSSKKSSSVNDLSASDSCEKVRAPWKTPELRLLASSEAEFGAGPAADAEGFS